MSDDRDRSRERERKNREILARIAAAEQNLVSAYAERETSDQLEEGVIDMQSVGQAMSMAALPADFNDAVDEESDGENVISRETAILAEDDAKRKRRMEGFLYEEDQVALRREEEALRAKSRRALEQEFRKREKDEMRLVSAEVEHAARDETETIEERRREFVAEQEALSASRSKYQVDQRSVDEARIAKQHSVNTDTARNAVKELERTKGRLYGAAPSSEAIGRAESSVQRPAKKKVILIMTVDIGDGRVAQIKVHAGDKASDLATLFIRENKLPDAVHGPLTQHIQSNIDAIPKKGPEVDAEDDGGDENSPPVVPQAREKKPARAVAKQPTLPVEKQQPAAIERAPTAPVEKPVNSQVAAPTQRDSKPLANDFAPRSVTEPESVRDPQPLARRQSSGGMHLEFPMHSRSRPSSAPRERVRQPSATDFSKWSESAFGLEHVPSISAKSRVLTSRDPKRRGSSVFQRLHASAAVSRDKREEKRVEAARESDVDGRSGSAKRGTLMSTVSRELMRDRDAGDFSNYGERLYAESIAKREKRKVEVEQKKKERADKEISSATFRPKITSMAQRMRRETADTYVRLSKQDAEDAESRRGVLARNVTARQMEDCTFKPKLSSRTRRIMKSKERVLQEQNMSHYDQLFLDAQRRQEQQDEYEHMKTKRPQSAQPLRGSSQMNNPDYLNRLVYSRLEVEEHLEQLRAEKNAPIDPSTGRKLFQPQVGRAPKSQRSRASSSIGDALYAERQELDWSRHRLIAEEETRVQELANATKVTDHSEKLLSKLRVRKLKEIFSILDVDQDGLISVESDAVERLPPDISKEVLPALEEIRDEGISKVSFGDFVERIESRWQRLKSGPRTLLLRRASSHQRERPAPVDDDVHEATFKPQISRRSVALAKQRGANLPIHEVLLADAKKAAINLELLRKEETERLLGECTFRPKILTASHRKGHPDGAAST